MNTDEIKYLNLHEIIKIGSGYFGTECFVRRVPGGLLYTQYCSGGAVSICSTFVPFDDFKNKI